MGTHIGGGLCMKETKEFKKSKLGLKGRILWIMIPLIIVAIAATMIVAFVYNQNVIIDRTMDIVEYSAKANANAIDKDLGGALKELYVYKLSMADGRMTKIQLSRMLKNTYQKSDLYPDGLYYSDSSGSWIDGSGWQPEDGYVVTDQEWFKEGTTHQDGFELGEPYLDEASNVYVVTASVNISDSDSVVKILAADIPLTSLITYVRNISFFNGAGGSLLVNTHDGSIIAASTMDDNMQLNVNSSVQKLYDTICSTATAEETDAVSQIKAGNEQYYVSAQKLDGCDWKLISYVSKEDAVLNKLREAFVIVALISCLILLISIVIIDRFIHHKAMQIKKVTNAIEKITEGDFTQSLQVQSHDETGVMTYSLHCFLEQMRAVLQKLNEMTRLLENQSGQSKSMSQDLANSSASSHQAMEEMIRTLDQLSHSVEEIAESSTSLATNVTSTNDRCKKANDVLMETVGLSEEGKTEMDEVGKSMTKIREVIAALSGAVENVGSNMKSITDMVNVIGDISDQTNLLSLNASIEAARAGDAGRGFAVVAQEIGALADNSSKSVVDIKGVTESINAMVVQMVEKMKESVASIGECGEIVTKTQSTFSDINTKILHTKDEVLAIIDEVVELDTVSQSLAAITEEQSASSEEMLATSESILSHSEQVKENAVEGEETAAQLSNIVNELNELLAFFQIEQGQTEQ